MTLEQSLSAVASDHKPSIVIACAKRGDAVEGKVHTEMSVAMSLGDMKMAEVVPMMAGVKLVYLQLCDHLAKRVGVPEQELHNAIAEYVNSSRTSGGPPGPFGPSGEG